MMCDGDTEDRLPRLRKDAIPHYQILARGWPALLGSSLVALRGHLRVPKSQRQCAEQMHFFHLSVLLLRSQTSQGFDRNLQSSQCLYRLFFGHFYDLVHKTICRRDCLSLCSYLNRTQHSRDQSRMNHVRLQLHTVCSRKAWGVNKTLGL